MKCLQLTPVIVHSPYISKDPVETSWAKGIHPHTCMHIPTGHFREFNDGFGRNPLQKKPQVDSAGVSHCLLRTGHTGTQNNS